MEKIIIILLLCTTLCSCGTQADNVTDVTEKQKNASASPSVVSGSAVVSESPVPTTRAVRRKRRVTESRSCSLYYMDCNGENVKQIWKGTD